MHHTPGRAGLGNAEVLSVFLPYVCDNCEAEKMILADAEKLGDSSSVAESIPCDSCKKGEMEFDGLPKQYFSFKK